MHTCTFLLPQRKSGNVLTHFGLEEWLEEAETDPDLLDCIAKYAHGQGERTMTEIFSGLEPQFIQMAKEQDAIGWRWVMEGMISRSMRKIQYNFHYQEGTKMNPNSWAQGLILKLLKATSEVQSKMIIMGHQISSCHVQVVRSFFIL